MPVPFNLTPRHRSEGRLSNSSKSTDTSMHGGQRRAKADTTAYFSAERHKACANTPPATLRGILPFL
jgi:hypothetical protein